MGEDMDVESIALKTLRDKASTLDINVPFEIISKIYDVERDSQYDEDRQPAVQAIKEIVERFIKGKKA